MGAMASQITSLTIVYSTVYSGADQRKHQSSGLCAGNSPVTGEFPAQIASNAENVSIWWRHHEHLIHTEQPDDCSHRKKLDPESIVTAVAPLLLPNVA